MSSQLISSHPIHLISSHFIPFISYYLISSNCISLELLLERVVKLEEEQDLVLGDVRERRHGPAGGCHWHRLQKHPQVSDGHLASVLQSADLQGGRKGREDRRDGGIGTKGGMKRESNTNAM